jgi:hypothetical protein
MAANYVLCCNRHIVGEMLTHDIKTKAPAVCPDILEVPISQYSVPILKAFVKMYNDNKLPKDQRKPCLIRFIRDNFPDCISIPNDVQVEFNDIV